MNKAEVKELIRPVRRNKGYETSISAPEIGFFQIDLMQMTQQSSRNKGFNYGFVIIDIYSRYGDCIPIKTKTAQNTLEALEKFREKHKDVKMYSLTSDNGSEFKGAFAEYCEEHDISQNMVSVGDHHVLGLVDRFIQTLRQKMLAEWLRNGNVDWISKVVLREAEELKVRQRVRVLIKKDFFEKKSSSQNWSNEVYEVKERDGNRYLLDGKPGRWARWALLKTSFPLTENRLRKETLWSSRKINRSLGSAI